MDSKTQSTATSTPLFPANSAWKEEIDKHLVIGEELLLQGNVVDAERSFKKAEELAKEPFPELYQRQGLALFEYGSEQADEEILLTACRRLKKAHTILPESTEILQAWGNALVLLGEQTEEHHYILSASSRYAMALALGADTADLHWDYGIAQYHIGVRSEEAIDLQKALAAFEHASFSGEDLPSEFWIDYGSTSLLMASKIHGMQNIIKAVNCFKKATAKDERCFDSWCSLAEALQTLHESTHDEDHFLQADECFEKASKLGPHDSQQWLEWAKFLYHSARETSDVKRLRCCLEKCHQAHTCDPENPEPLAVWAEALALLGQLTERLDLLYEAENKIYDALDLTEKEPYIWLSLGRTYLSFASYFNDNDYFYQAIEKFQQGLSLDRTCDPLWHSIGLTYVLVGTLEEDVEVVANSLRFFERSLALKATSTRHIDYAKALAKIGEFSHDKGRLEQALYHFEMGLALQKNAVYLHPDWLFSYATTLDMIGDFHDEESYYTRAIELFSHVLMVDPDYQGIHHRLAQAFCHLGELSGTIDHFHRAIHHLRFALKREPESDTIILDWGITLINIAFHTQVLTDVDPLMHEAEHKITQSAKLGNVHSYYHLSCLYSILGDYEKSLYFLEKAEQFQALPPVEELMNDEWLEGLRSTSDFIEFLSENPHLQQG